MTELEVFLQQLTTGLSNGMIIALIALGYTMVYGIVELINFAHGDLFMLGAFAALTTLSLSGLETVAPGSALSFITVLTLVLTSALFCGVVNVIIERLAYRPLRSAPKLTSLFSAIGVSFILINIGLFWGGLPLDVFGGGTAAAAPKDFPSLLSSENLLGDSAIQFSWRDLTVFLIAPPTMLLLTCFVKFTKLGKAMRATAQNPSAAILLGIDTNKVISTTFFIGGALAGVGSVIYSLSYNTIYFQMGFRAGLDAFTAAVLGGIGNLPGAMLGGIMIGILRAFSDQYIATQWTNVCVFGVLILTLVFRPTGLLGTRVREKV